MRQSLLALLILGLNKRWLHQHKQSVDARYRCSTQFRSYFLQCRQQSVQQPGSGVRNQGSAGQ